MRIKVTRESDGFRCPYYTYTVEKIRNSVKINDFQFNHVIKACSSLFIIYDGLELETDALSMAIKDFDTYDVTLTWRDELGAVKL